VFWAAQQPQGPDVPQRRGTGVPASPTETSPYFACCPESPVLGEDRGMAGARWLSQGCLFCPSTLTSKTLSWEHGLESSRFGQGSLHDELIFIKNQSGQN